VQGGRAAAVHRPPELVVVAVHGPAERRVVGGAGVIRLGERVFVGIPAAVEERPTLGALVRTGSLHSVLWLPSPTSSPPSSMWTGRGRGPTLHARAPRARRVASTASARSSGSRGRSARGPAGVDRDEGGAPAAEHGPAVAGAGSGLGTTAGPAVAAPGSPAGAAVARLEGATHSVLSLRETGAADAGLEVAFGGRRDADGLRTSATNQTSPGRSTRFVRTEAQAYAAFQAFARSSFFYPSDLRNAALKLRALLVPASRSGPRSSS